MAQYLCFEEVASKLKCSIKKVRQLVIEDKSLRANRITPNGLVLTECGLDGHFPYDLNFNCHLDDDGAITSDIYRTGTNGETEKIQTLFVGYLRVECSELAQFITVAGFVDLPNELTPTKTLATLPAQTTTLAPVVATGKKWTPEKLAELKAFREAHTEPETAKQFGISGARIRQLLPTGKPQKKPYSVFTHRN